MEVCIPFLLYILRYVTITGMKYYSICQCRVVCNRNVTGYVRKPLMTHSIIWSPSADTLVVRWLILFSARRDHDLRARPCLTFRLLIEWRRGPDEVVLRTRRKSLLPLRMRIRTDSSLCAKRRCIVAQSTREWSARKEAVNSWLS